MARSTLIHPTAVVEPGAELAVGVAVGPLCYVGAGARIDEGTELVAQATVLGPSHIGRNNRVFPHATLGAAPQDKSYSGESTTLVVGDDNQFREGVTVHRGTIKGGGVTRIGSGCLFMALAHVAHDCVVEDGVTLTTGTTLGGHVVVGARAVLGGHVAVAPFVRLGELCFAAGGAMIERDVPPFVIVAGDRARVRGLNRVGLERAGVPEASQVALKAAYRCIFSRSAVRTEAAKRAEAEWGTDPYVRRLIDFLAGTAE
jgi:UDP-N-acetylglucosamine acyltransferase